MNAPAPPPPSTSRSSSTPAPSATLASRLLLVRHGQSTWNAQGRWQGQADPPLTDAGVEQAESAAAAIARADAMWSSDLQRAHRTATILASRHDVAVTTDVRMRERVAGEWTGLTLDEIEARYPGHLATGDRPEGFESDDSLVARVFDALHEFADHLAGGVGVVVTHGGVILAVERAHGVERTPIRNLDSRWIEVDGHGSPTGFTVGERIPLL